MNTKGIQHQRITQKTWFLKMSSNSYRANTLSSKASILPFLLIIISALSMFCLHSCTNTASQIQGNWRLTGKYNGEYIDDYMEVEFIGDSLQINTDPYYNEKDTIRIKLKDNKWMWYDSKNNEYYTIATIESLSRTKIVLRIITDSEEVLIHEFNRIAPKQDFSNEKEIPQQKYKKKIIGEWEFIAKKNRYGEWKDYGDPIGWNMIFEKNGDGYQIRNKKTITFNWLMPADKNIVILSGSIYEDDSFVINSMTNNTMRFMFDGEVYKLIRVK